MRTLMSQADGFWHRQAARAKGTTITRWSGTDDTDGCDETTCGKASMPKTIVVTSTASIAELTPSTALAPDRWGAALVATAPAHLLMVSPTCRIAKDQSRTYSRTKSACNGVRCERCGRCPFRHHAHA